LARLTGLGVLALRQALDEIKAGRVARRPQLGEPSAAPLIRRDDARIDLSRPAAEIHDLVRGMRLWPRAYLGLSAPGARQLLVLRTALEPAPGAADVPFGIITRIERDKGFLVQCQGRSVLWFVEVQPEGKKPIPAADFLNGLRLGPGDRLPLAS